MSASRRLQPWMLVSAAWLIPALLGAINVIAQHQLWSGGRPALAQVLFDFIDWLLYAALTPFVFMASRRWPLARPHLAAHGALHLAISLIFCAAWAGGGTLLKVALQPGDLERGAGFAFTSWLFTTLPFGVSVYLAVVGIEHAIRYFVDARAQETQVARLSEQLTGARLAALQAQLNPHFLFNSLNTIAVLVRDHDTPAATRVIEQLSDVLRRTLNRTASEVSLDEELDLVRQYLAVEQARFSDRLRPVFDVDPAALSGAVPSFALQHLVENAIRHGIARRSGAGRVAIAARRSGDTLAITVEDDGAGIEGAATPTGHGLANTRERLRTLYGERASLTMSAASPQGTIATLVVPWREMALDVKEPDAG